MEGDHFPLNLSMAQSQRTILSWVGGFVLLNILSKSHTWGEGFAIFAQI